jgi:hypothetical protein
MIDFSHLHFINGSQELRDCASNYDNIGAFLGQFECDSFAHAIRATGDNNTLE